jgi:hypothetical protein
MGGRRVTGLPLGSVAFSGSQWSNLYHEFSGTQPSAYTWSGWVKTDATPTHGCFVKVGKIQETYTQGSGFAFGFGSTRFDPSYSGTNIVVIAESVAWKNGSAISDLTSWNHYAAVVNGNSFTVYKNGQSFYSASQSPRNDSPHGVYMGGYSGTTQTVERFLACRMTRCAMWSRALSASEIAADYADGKNAPTTTSGLEHFWPMSSADNYLADAVGSATLTAGTGGVTISTDSPFA